MNSILLWVAVIMIMAALALWLDNRFGEPGLSEPKTKIDYNKIDRKKLPRVTIPKPRNIGQEQLLTGKETGDGEVYGYVLFNGEFRPMKLTEDFYLREKNGRIPIRMAHCYYNEEDRPIWVPAKDIYMTEAYPGHYAELVTVERISIFLAQESETNER